MFKFLTVKFLEKLKFAFWLNSNCINYGYFEYPNQTNE